MSIRSLTRRITTDAQADAVVQHVHSHTYLPGASETHYLEKYFDQTVRAAVFHGGMVSGRYIKLSPAAQRLKRAFQRRYVNSGGVDFPPTVAYHRTSSQHIVGLIAESGFKLANGYVGKGVCFFTGSARAEGYQAPVMVHPAAPNFPLAQVIVEVVVFSRLARNNTLPTGSDTVAHYHEPSDIMTVKNPLVIFPKAVFLPGEKLTNVTHPDPAWHG